MNNVVISLQPYYADYLRYITKSEDSKCIRIDRLTILGRFIYSQVQKSHVPVKRKSTDKDIEIELSEVRFSHMEDFFLYFTKEGEQLINDFIKVNFDIEFAQYMLVSKSFKLLQKDAINLFIDSYKLSLDKITTDALKKKDFRYRKKIKNLLSSTIQSVYTE